MMLELHSTLSTASAIKGNQKVIKQYMHYASMDPLENLCKSEMKTVYRLVSIDVKLIVDMLKGRV